MTDPVERARDEVIAAAREVVAKDDADSVRQLDEAVKELDRRRAGIGDTLTGSPTPHDDARERLATDPARLLGPT